MQLLICFDEQQEFEYWQLRLVHFFVLSKMSPAKKFMFLDFYSKSVTTKQVELLKILSKKSLLAAKCITLNSFSVRWVEHLESFVQQSDGKNLENSVEFSR